MGLVEIVVMILCSIVWTVCYYVAGASEARGHTRRTNRGRGAAAPKAPDNLVSLEEFRARRDEAQRTGGLQQ